MFHSAVYHIKTYFLVGLVSILFTSPSFAAQKSALPKRIQAHYVITKDGEEIAKVHEQYVVTGNQYKIESTTKGIGIYALMGVRKLTSTGKVTNQGLQPAHFELRQSTSAKKTLIADFDWASNTLTMLVKGETRTAKLSAGTQDLASFTYQFMFLPRPPNEKIAVSLTTGKKLNVYEYQNNEPLGKLKVGGKEYQTVHLVPSNQEQGQVETKELWLAANQQYLLVRLLMIDENGEKLEQTLTELHVE
ncbi:MAG TPA: DUF3108 domain-containing protein [Methylotenera sp.]|nr:DUF3108 domain-containing protein [Methylotenera sp.]HPH06189.1 DUF3108 domain-containing protein [Methylotenera sp.]HPN02064.1 DUF3108 domain-containing protein [Methylotenera sp.]